VLTGIFLACLGALAFEVISVRTIGFVLGSGYIYFVIALAMLGLSAAGSILSLMNLSTDERRRKVTLFWISICLAISYVATEFIGTALKSNINAHVAKDAAAGGFDAVVLSVLSGRIWAAIALGALISVPYFLVGSLLSIVFATARSSDIHRLYFADLLGAAVGCGLAYFFMEYMSFSSTALLPAVFSLLAAGCFAAREFKGLAVASTVAAVLTCGLSMSQFFSAGIEPQAQLNTIARDYSLRSNVTEIWRGWNSFTRISALEIESAAGRSHVMALGNGEGHAELIPYQREGYGEWAFTPAKLAFALGTPKDLLVLFAGVGADMLAADYYAEGKSNITGVELNRTMIEGARGLPAFDLDAFYTQPHINMVAQEARAFLHSDQTKYDVVLLSWSGATTAYYSGAMGHTTQFVYTAEALEAIVDRLKPGGFIVYMNTNKVNTLAAIRDREDRRGNADVARTAIVLYAPNNPTSAWDRWWDENRLLYKPDGFTTAEIAAVRRAADALGLRVAYEPGGSEDAGYAPYRKVLTDYSLDQALQELQQSSNLRFSVVRDDRPFSFDLFLTKRYLSGEFWRDSLKPRLATSYENYRVQQTLFVLAVAVAALMLIVGPMLFNRSAIVAFPAWPRALVHLAYFSCLGTGFMLIEISVMHKMSLLFGNPGLSIAIVLASLIFFSGVGSLISDRALAAGLTSSRVVVLLLAYAAAYLLLSDQLVAAALGLDELTKAICVFLVLAPLGLVLGQLFPQGLRRARVDGPALVPWAWAINGATGTIAAGIAPLLAQAIGFKALLVVGVVSYAVILVLPLYGDLWHRRQSLPAH
jgi:hypothetical protein